MRNSIHQILFFILLLSPTLSLAQYLTSDNYKFKVLNKVLHQIAMAKGDNRIIPTLKIPTEKNKLAVYFAGKNEHFIYIDEEVYDICTSLGKDSLNAIACIIGHELGHYYEDHNDHFGYSYEENHHNKKNLEDAADKFSLFYGAVAGFDTPRVFPEILNKVYQEYKRDEKIPGYPDLKDRQAIVETAIEEIEEFINIYRLGQNLYAINNFQAAKNCMEFIINHYPSKIVHNNIGVCNLSIYLKEVTNQEAYPYIYPFEFDIRVKKTDDLPPLVSRTHHFQLIDNAIQSFKEAIHIDPFYETAYINLACSYSIRGNQDAASGTINELQTFLEKENKNLSENAYLIKGISKAMNEDYINAQKAFEHLQTVSDINKYNKDILAAETQHETSYFDDFKKWVDDYFDDNIDPKTLNIKIDQDREFISNKIIKNIVLDSSFKEIDLGNWVAVYFQDKKDHFVYIYRSKNTEIKMLIALDNYNGKTAKNIKIGDDYSSITSKQFYGYPSFRWNRKPLSILTYEQGNIGFLFEEDELTNWFTWSLKR